MDRSFSTSTLRRRKKVPEEKSNGRRETEGMVEERERASEKEEERERVSERERGRETLLRETVSTTWVRDKGRVTVQRVY